tara:strand:- start:4066 stop:4620 length:555 start_codon:yes stop_codon:yes gene_type:complete
MTIRDLLLTFAETDFFKPFWSKDIQEEWRRNLIQNRPDLDPDRIFRITLAMDEYFPDALVEDWDLMLSPIQLPDRDDHHVMAAAITCKANFLVTSNLKDFPSATLDKYGIKPIHPDDFCLLLIHQNQKLANKSFRNMVARLKNPPRSVSEVLATLVKTDLPKTASILAKLTDNSEGNESVTSSI